MARISTFLRTSRGKVRQALAAKSPDPEGKARLRPRDLASPRVLGRILVLVGVLLLAEGAVTVLWKEPFSAILTARAQGELSDELKELEAGAGGEREIRTQAASMNLKAPPGKALGRLQVRKLDLDMVIVQEANDTVLQKGPAHYSETPLPGANGKWTVGIAGHRTTYQAPFRNIDKLKPGDDITLNMPYGRFTYKTEGTKIVDATEAGVFRPQGYNRLALTACHPLYSDAQRIVAYARLTGVARGLEGLAGRAILSRRAAQSRKRGSADSQPSPLRGLAGRSDKPLGRKRR